MIEIMERIGPGWGQQLQASLAALLPEVFLTLLLVGVLIADLIRPHSHRLVGGFLSLGGLLVLMGWMLYQGPPVGKVSAFSGMVVIDKWAWYFRLILAGAHVLTLLQSFAYFKKNTRPTGEYFTLLVGLHLGLVAMSMANHLLFAFLSIELASVCGYLLTAWLRGDKQSADASVKYMLYGIFSSGVMLYGISLIYGLTGSLEFSALHAGLQTVPMAAGLTALLLVMGGFAYKAGLVPFHFWVPDVYQASAYPVGTLLAGMGKLGAFALLLRWFREFPAAGLWDDSWLHVLIGLAIVSMLWGNLAAWGQTHFRRLLAYSSIGHGGVMLLAVAVGGDYLHGAFGFYLLVYAVLTYGAFMAGQLLLPWGETFAEWTRVGKRGLGATVALSLLLPALAGLPPTAGFTAKLGLFVPLWQHYANTHDGWVLAGLIVALLTTLLGIYYYLKPLIYLVLRKRQEDTASEAEAAAKAPVLLSVVILLAITTLVLGLGFYDLLISWLAAP